MTTVTEIAEQFASPADRRARGVVEFEWVWRGYLARRAVSLLAGAPKKGKSTLAAAIAEAIASGAGSFLGHATATAPVIYITEEAETTALQKLHHDRVLVLTRGDVWPRPSWPDLVAAAGDVATRAGAALLIVDTFPAWANFAENEENDTGAVQRALEPLFGIASQGLAVLLIAHPPRNGGHAVRGAGALEGGVDAIARLVEGKEASARVLEITARWETPADARLRWDRVEGWSTSTVVAQGGDLDRVREALVQQPGMGKRELRDALRGVMGNPRIDLAVQQGLESGAILNRGTDARPALENVPGTLRHAAEAPQTTAREPASAKSDVEPDEAARIVHQGSGSGSGSDRDNVPGTDPSPVGGSAPARSPAPPRDETAREEGVPGTLAAPSAPTGGTSPFDPMGEFA